MAIVKICNITKEIPDIHLNQKGFDALIDIIKDKPQVLYTQGHIEDYGYVSFEHKGSYFVKFAKDLINCLEYENPWDACTGKLCQTKNLKFIPDENVQE